MLQTAAFSVFGVCFILWSLAFVSARKRAAGQREVARAPVSAWGILLEGIGFALVFMRVQPENFEKSDWSLMVSMILSPLSAALGWAAVRHLGKQWRYQAGLNEDHELIQTGPYRWIRHPIYASMLGFLLAVAAAWTWWPMILAGLTMFLAGTEIRVRAEDRLLASRFGERFREYQSRVPAYIPFIR
ncbi:MAG TPA: isoprenylcysteine carboxylmethyltransferase family protein [Bryobacteraceae bacterium]|nr:isoprenylcysteine carboxylmethyltransferase family protein [Bryobacteraceae bacterium]